MRSYVLYDKVGRVLQVSEIPKDSLWMAAQDYGGRIVEITDESLLDEEVSGLYVSLDGSKPVVTRASRISLSTSIAGLTAYISGSPEGSVIEVEGERLASEQNEIEIEFDAPGTYEIRIYPPPQYRDEVLEVTVG